MKGGEIMVSKNSIKIFGIVATVAGIGASLITDWVNEKKMDEKIDEKINDALASREECEDDEEEEA